MKICIGGDALGMVPPREGEETCLAKERLCCVHPPQLKTTRNNTPGVPQSKSVPEVEGEMHAVENHGPLGTSVRKSPVDDIWASVG